MYHNKHIGNADDPFGVFNGQHDVVQHALSKCPVPRDCYGEVAVANKGIRKVYTFHVWLECAPLNSDSLRKRRLRARCQMLQFYIHTPLQRFQKKRSW